VIVVKVMNHDHHSAVQLEQGRIRWKPRGSRDFFANIEFLRR